MKQTNKAGQDIGAALIGLVLAAVVFVMGCGLAAVWNTAECGSEYRPFLGSGKQTFAVYGCLARDAGPLIELKKRLGIYDPAWKPVIK